MTTQMQEYEGANDAVALAAPVWVWDFVLSAAKDQVAALAKTSPEVAMSINLVLQPLCNQFGRDVHGMATKPAQEG